MPHQLEKLRFGRDVILLQLDVDDHESITVSGRLVMTRHQMKSSTLTEAVAGDVWHMCTLTTVKRSGLLPS